MRRTIGRRAFTLVEMLVVIVIVGILASLAMLAVIHFIRVGRIDATKAQIRALGAACENYRIQWGDYPPSDLHEVGGRGLNDLNNGIEALAACLSSRRGGGIKYQAESELDNVDGDAAGSNITDWYFGDAQLREYVDAWGYPFAYFHHKDYAGKNPRVLKYVFSKDAGAMEVRPRKNPATGTFLGPASFQIWSVGEDGKPGTKDDIDLTR